MLVAKTTNRRYIIALHKTSYFYIHLKNKELHNQHVSDLQNMFNIWLLLGVKRQERDVDAITAKQVPQHRGKKKITSIQLWGSRRHMLVHPPCITTTIDGLCIHLFLMLNKIPKVSLFLNFPEFLYHLYTFRQSQVRKDDLNFGHLWFNHFNVCLCLY